MPERAHGPAKTRRHVTFADVDPGALADLRSVADRAGIGTSRLSFLSVR
jgi:hypothetical protein